MFLNKTKFKKMIKNAFQHDGLVVGRIYEGLVIAGKRWVVWVEDGSIPNWVKAAVMEYSGELPKPETIFKAVKNEPIQYEIAENSYYDLSERFRNSHYTFLDTEVELKTSGIRLLQARNTGKVMGMPGFYIDVIDLRELEGDNPPMGPVARSEIGDVLIWKNENSAYAVSTAVPSTDRTLSIMQYLEAVDFSKEDR